MASATVDLLHVLAYLYLRFGYRRRALALLRVAAAKAPGNQGTLPLLAYALVLNKAPDEALVVIGRLGRLEPASLRAALLLESQALLLLGRKAEARRCFQRFVALRSQDRREAEEAASPAPTTAAAAETAKGWLA